MGARRFTVLAAGLILLGFIAANLLVQPLTSRARLDLTGSGLYTLSDGTRRTLDSLGEPVDLTLIYTRRVGQEYPAVRAYARRVRELLESYEARSGGRLNVREIDPQPYSPAEDMALASGLQAIETSGEDPLYFGLIGRNRLDDERVITYLAPEQEASLEYDVTRMIARLDDPEPARIGILSTLDGMRGGGAGGYTLLQEIAARFELIEIEPDFAELPADLDVLLLAHPPEMTDWQAWLVDQHLMRRGRAIFLVDPAAKTARADYSRGTGERQIRSDLGALSETLGVSLSRMAVADTETALQVRAAQNEGDQPLRHPLFLAVDAALMSQASLVTSELSRSVNLGAPGNLRTSRRPGLVHEVLMRTGPAPSPIEPEIAAGDISAAQTLSRYQPGPQPAALAVRVSGDLETAFGDGKPPAPQLADPVMDEIASAAWRAAPGHLARSEGPVDVLVVSDADLVDDGLYVNLETAEPFADNGALILNALDLLSGEAGLLSLRARAPGQRPMQRVDDMRNAAQTDLFDEQIRLEASLAEARARYDELREIGAGEAFPDGAGGAHLSLEEQEELSALRQEIMETRGRLRTIERDFRRGIDGLEFRLELINLLLGPALILLFGLAVWWRARRREAKR